MSTAADKIQDPELSRFAKALQPNEVRSVIVELKGEPVSLLLPRGMAHRPGDILPAPRSLDIGAMDDVQSSMDDLEGQLRSLGLERDLVRLNAAQAFVVTVTPDQLRAVSELSEVGCVRPNRIHRPSQRM